jgi:Ca2+/H+ antiporter
VIIQTVVQNALRRLRQKRSQSATEPIYRRKTDQETDDDDAGNWSRQEILPWLIAFVIGLALVAAVVVAFT